MASMLAIGVLCDRRYVYAEAVDYYKHGKGDGAIAQAVAHLFPRGLGQWQESGRDQGHNTPGIALMGSPCEMAWNQGDDLHGYDDDPFLAGAEYNLGQDLPHVDYRNRDVDQPHVTDAGRGNPRPCWDLVYTHYVNRRGLAAPFVTAFALMVPRGRRRRLRAEQRRVRPVRLRHAHRHPPAGPTATMIPWAGAGRLGAPSDAPNPLNRPAV